MKGGFDSSRRELPQEKRQTGLQSLARIVADACGARAAGVAVRDPARLRVVATAPGEDVPAALRLADHPALRAALANEAPTLLPPGSEPFRSQRDVLVPVVSGGRVIGALVLAEPSADLAGVASALEHLLPLAGAHLTTWLEGEAIRAQRRSVVMLHGLTQELIANCPLPIRIVDLDGRILQWNPASERMFGWTADEVRGIVLPTVPLERRPVSLARIRRVAETGEPSETQLRQRRRDGTHVVVNVRLLPLLDNEGHEAAVMAVARVIDDDSRVDELYHRVLGLVTNALKSPLTALAGYVQLLHRPEIAGDSAQRERTLESVGAQVTELTSLIDDLLMLSELEEGPLRLERERMDLPALVRDEVRDFIEHRDRPVVLELERRAPVIAADRRRVKQALGHLLDNAAAYSPPDGQIWVTVTSGDGALAVTVADEGDGIPSDEVPRVFDRFYRGSGARGQGAGIGLHLVGLIAEAHGGEVLVESEPGAGCKVCLRLPLTDD